MFPSVEKHSEFIEELSVYDEVMLPHCCRIICLLYISSYSGCIEISPEMRSNKNVKNY